MNYKISLIIFLLCYPLFSSNFDDKIISSIIVLGNQSTSEEVIKREMLLQIGDAFNDSLRVLSEKRITNLFLFNHVEIIPVEEDSNVSLTVNVTERLFIFPFPKFIIEDRDWDKLTYGFGLAHINFRGQNEKIIGTLLFGYRPGYQLDYYNPWINGTQHITTGFTIKHYETSHQVLNHTEKFNLITTSLGKYWTRYFNNIISFNYTQIINPKELAPRMLTGNRTENLFSVSLSANYDNRDLFAYPSQGWFIGASYTRKGFFEKKIDYTFYKIDIRKYFTFSNITFASRAALLLSDGKELPIYDRIYFGFTERIRGHFSDVVAGEHLALAGAEIRFPLLPTKRINLPSLFLPESSTRNLKFGLNGAFFYDTGKVWGKDILEEFNIVSSGLNNQIISGFGASLHFMLPYIEVARLETAFDEDMNPEIIFEIGTAL